MLLEYDKESGRYIVRIDASLMKENDCDRYILLKLIKGLCKPETYKNPSMEYGTSFHKGLRLRAEGKDLDTQLKEVTAHFSQPDIVVPDNEWRNMGHLVNTYVQYDKFWKSQGDLIIPMNAELRFAFPFYKTERVEVLLCGTIDLVAMYLDQLIIVDHKTTSAWNIDEYLAEYDLSPQLMIYKWVYDTLNLTDVGCMINGIFLSKTGAPKFKRSEVIRYSKEQTDDFISGLETRVERMVQGIEELICDDKSGIYKFPPNYNCCMKRYGEKASPCAFCIVCKQPTLEERLAVAESVYEKRVYDPSTFQQ